MKNTTKWADQLFRLKIGRRKKRFVGICSSPTAPHQKLGSQPSRKTKRWTDRLLQGSNLRANFAMDFKSITLTTRSNSQLPCCRAKTFYFIIPARGAMSVSCIRYNCSSFDLTWRTIVYSRTGGDPQGIADKYISSSPKLFILLFQREGLCQ